MRIVVTGSKGFIGSHLVRELRRKKYIIIELDIENGYDITNWDQIKNITGFDAVIHLAAIVYVPRSYEIPREMYTVNVIGTLNMLELCRVNNAKMIFMSSYMYGNPKYLPIDEEHPVLSVNPYSQSKIIAEQLCKSYNLDFGVQTTIFRPFNVYGADQSDNFLIPSIIKQVKTNNEIILENPEPKRDFVHINDVVDILLKALNVTNDSCNIFNIGSGKNYSVQEIVDIVRQNSNTDVKVKYTRKKRKNEILETKADISKAKKYLNWEPNSDMNEEIKKLMI